MTRVHQAYQFFPFFISKGLWTVNKPKICAILSRSELKAELSLHTTLLNFAMCGSHIVELPCELALLRHLSNKANRMQKICNCTFQCQNDHYYPNTNSILSSIMAPDRSAWVGGGHSQLEWKDCTGRQWCLHSHNLQPDYDGRSSQMHITVAGLPK